MFENIAVVGLDLAKRVFQVHAVSAGGAVAIRQKLRRGWHHSPWGQGSFAPIQELCLYSMGQMQTDVAP